MVFTIGLGDAIWSGRIPGASFFIMMIVIIKSSPETIKQICFLLNYEVNNTQDDKRNKNRNEKSHYYKRSADKDSFKVIV